MAKLTAAAILAIVRPAGAAPPLDLVMTAAAGVEGRYDPQAVGDGGASLGLWQINDIHGLSRALRLDPA